MEESKRLKVAGVLSLITGIIGVIILVSLFKNSPRVDLESLDVVGLMVSIAYYLLSFILMICYIVSGTGVLKNNSWAIKFMRYTAISWIITSLSPLVFYLISILVFYNSEKGFFMLIRLISEGLPIAMASLPGFIILKLIKVNVQ